VSELWDDPKARKWVAHVRHQLLPMIAGSAMTVAINPGDEPDVKAAVELGLSILLDKPIIVVNPEMRPIAEHLRRVADAVIEGDLSDAEVVGRIHAAMDRYRDG